MRLLSVWTTDVFDLVLARRCLDCLAPGRAWCARCLADCPRSLVVEAAPAHRPPLAVACAYEAIVREAIVDYKEHGNRALAPMLGQLLAEAVAVHLHRLHSTAAILVPVPGHRRPARGFDALGGIVRESRRHLARDGMATVAVPAVQLVRDIGPIKTLGRRDRQAAVADSMRAASPRVIAGLRRARAPVLVVDDVVTTGGTVAAVAAALGAAGVEPAGIAAVARAG